MSTVPHICVCICTFKRPRLLRKLLKALEAQETGELFSYCASIADNDHLGSARPIVEDHLTWSKLDIRYAIEPEQNISLARNKAIANSSGDLIALIDDDEIPRSTWLLSLYRAMLLFETAGILGPVLPYYETKPPRWVIKGRFFDRASYYTGHYLPWRLCQTGNCLLKRTLFEDDCGRFDPCFGSGGEDRDFFKRMNAKGHVFVWCTEAPISELVPRERWSMRSLLKRALLRGKMTFQSRKNNVKDLLTSYLLLFPYSLALPFLFVYSPIFGYSTFMEYLVKFADHLGKLFALFHIDIVKERYIV